MAITVQIAADEIASFGGSAATALQLGTISMRKHVSRNARCPCGSGKKYKQCCRLKGIEWMVQDDGTVTRSVPLSPETVEVLEGLRESYRATHGREPGVGDRVFEGAPPLEIVEHIIIQTMKKAGIDPALIYACEKTGLILNTRNEHQVPDPDIAEWDAAVEEYERQTGTEASHRRLNEDDILAILANRPKQ